MRQVYQAFPLQQICQTLSDKSLLAEKSRRCLENRLPNRAKKVRHCLTNWAWRDVSARFPLPWSAYVRLLSVTSEQARKFYEAEALRGGWSVRQLDRQINSLFYERTAFQL
jgi:hypothetical protein